MVVSWKSQLAPEATLPAINVLTLLKMSLDRFDKKDPSEPIPRNPTTLTPPAHHPRTTALRRPHTINQYPFGPTAPLRLRPAAAQRDRAGASIGSDQTLPQREARKPQSSPKLPCERRPGPAEPPPSKTTCLKRQRSHRPATHPKKPKHPTPLFHVTERNLIRKPQAMSLWTTSPNTSVRRKSRPCKR